MTLKFFIHTRQSGVRPKMFLKILYTRQLDREPKHFKTLGTQRAIGSMKTQLKYDFWIFEKIPMTTKRLGTRKRKQYFKGVNVIRPIKPQMNWSVRFRYWELRGREQEQIENEDKQYV